MKNYYQLLWVVFGAAYGLLMRVSFAHAPDYLGVKVISFAFIFGTHFVIGAIVIYGLRYTKPTIWKMIWAL
jgi:hypothetical protein